MQLNKQEALFQYCLRLADSGLILGHRLSEWCGHGPILEQDIALINIALDQLGQANLYLEYAAEVEGKGRTADDMAYMRDVLDFRNPMLVEQPNGDFGKTIARQFLFDVYNYYLAQELKNSKDTRIAAIAEKSLKEISYHLRNSTDWVLRLGDGTEESHERMQTAFNELWMFTQDLFETNEADDLLVKEGIAADLKKIKEKWSKHVAEVLQGATLAAPDNNIFMLAGSKGGYHTEHLGYILADMQYLQKTYPGAKW